MGRIFGGVDVQVTLVAQLPGGLRVDVLADHAVGPVQGLRRQAAGLQVLLAVRLHPMPQARVVVQNRALHVLGVDGVVALHEGVADVVEL